MSYDITIYTMDRKSHAETVIGHHNITSNFAPVWELAGFDMDDLYIRNARVVVRKARDAALRLGTKPYAKDEWAPTMGNAGIALNKMADEIGRAIVSNNADWNDTWFHVSY